jgi:hypothetical protein
MEEKLDTSHFTAAGHLADSPKITDYLKGSVNDFREQYRQGWFQL